MPVARRASAASTAAVGALLIAHAAVTAWAFVLPAAPSSRIGPSHLQQPNALRRWSVGDSNSDSGSSSSSSGDVSPSPPSQQQQQQQPSSSPPPPPPPPPPAPVAEEEKLTPWEWFFGKEGELEADLRAVGVSRQRLLLNAGVATALALGANFVGVTSNLLGLLPAETVDDLKVDVLYPVKGFKRYVDEADGYEFRYPKAWLADQAVLLAETRERTEAAAAMTDIDPLRATRPIRIPGGRPRRPGQGVRPDAALGPPGGDSEENVSVVKSKVAPGFTLEGTLGPPRQAAETLLSTAIAPPGSGKNATLIDARAEDRGPGGQVYEFEYVVRRETEGRRRFALHSLSVIAARPREDTLFTLTVLAPEARWKEREAELRQVAQSFRLTR